MTNRRSNVKVAALIAAIGAIGNASLWVFITCLGAGFLGRTSSNGVVEPMFRLQPLIAIWDTINYPVNLFIRPKLESFWVTHPEPSLALRDDIVYVLTSAAWAAMLFGFIAYISLSLVEKLWRSRTRRPPSARG